MNTDWIPLYGPAVVGGLALGYVALKAKRRWSGPRCAGCGYDVRHIDVDKTASCPECGHTLGKRSGVVFARTGVSIRLLIVALFVVTSPLTFGLGVQGYEQLHAWLKPAPVVVAAPQQTDPTNQELIEQVATGSNHYQLWYTFERRAPEFTAEEAAALSDAMVACGESGTPPVWQRARSAATNALSILDERGLMTAEAKVAVARSVFQPQLAGTSNLKIFSDTSEFSVSFTPTGGANAFLGYQAFAHLEDVTVNDKPVIFRAGRTSSDRTRVTVHCGYLAPGTAKVTATYRVAMIPKAHLPPHSNVVALPPEFWHHVAAEWTVEVTRTIDIVEARQRPVALVREPASVGEAIKAAHVIEKAGVWTLSSKKPHSIKFVIRQDQLVDHPFAFHVYVRVGEKEYHAGSIVNNPGTAQRSVWSREFGCSVAEDFETVDVILRPDTSAFARVPEVESIWGEPIVYENIPLRRYDRDLAPAALENYEQRTAREPAGYRYRSVRVNGREAETSSDTGTIQLPLPGQTFPYNMTRDDREPQLLTLERFAESERNTLADDDQHAGDIEDAGR